MNYKISIQLEAEFDLEEAFKWYEEKSCGLGSVYRSARPSVAADAIAIKDESRTRSSGVTY